MDGVSVYYVYGYVCRYAYVCIYIHSTVCLQIIYNLFEHMLSPAAQGPQQGEREAWSVKRGDHGVHATEALSQGEVHLPPRGGSAA